MKGVKGKDILKKEALFWNGMKKILGKKGAQKCHK